MESNKSKFFRRYIDGRTKETLLMAMMTVKEFRFGKFLKWLPEYDNIVDWINTLHPYFYRGDRGERQILFSGRGLFLAGTTGVGKTFMGRYVIPNFMEIAYPFASARPRNEGGIRLSVGFENATKYEDVADRDTALFHFGKEFCDYNDERNAIELVDDIGAENPRNNFGQKVMVINDLINYLDIQLSEKGQLDTIPIFTTNLTLDQLATKYGDRFLSRMKSVFSHIVSIDEADMRGMADKPIDITSLPFYEDYTKFMEVYPNFCSDLSEEWKKFCNYLYCLRYVAVGQGKDVENKLVNDIIQELRTPHN